MNEILDIYLEDDDNYEPGSNGHFEEGQGDGTDLNGKDYINLSTFVMILSIEILKNLLDIKLDDDKKMVIIFIGIGSVTKG